MLAWYTYDLSTMLLLAVVLVACIFDVRSHRIPNRLVLTGIIGGVGLHAWYFDWQGTLTSASGLIVGGLILLPFYLVKVRGQRLMSAGDVKLMAAVGSFLGPLHVLLASGLTLAAGTLASVAYLLWHDALGHYLQRNWLTLKTLLLTHQWIYVAPEQGDVTMQRFPYSLAIAAGTLLALGHLSLLRFSHLRTFLSAVTS